MKFLRRSAGYRLGLCLSFSVFVLPQTSLAQCGGTSNCDLSPSLFVSRANLVEVKRRIAEDIEPYASFYNTFRGVASSLLDDEPDPFQMDNIANISFGWCGASGGEDDSLKDLVDKLGQESSEARNLAVAYLLSGDTAYADKAKDYMLAWAQQSTLVNFYDFNINFQSASFDGVEEGFCNNSWNMALDSIWQAYGLINFSDTYAILTRNGYSLNAQEQSQLANWLRNELLPATNAGFHAWTRWADLHTGSSAYTRYRNDNHLSWGLAGLAAVAAALNDDEIWSYAISGGRYDDGHSGPYANPSFFQAQIGRAIAESGEVYDQRVRADEHKGMFYGHFSLWALTLVAQIAETHKGDNYWTFAGTSGGSIVDAYDYYAPYGAGDRTPPDPEETTDPVFFRFLYEMLVGNDWVSGDREVLYTRARDRAARNQVVMQGIGPVSLVTGDLPEVVARRPKPPTEVDVEAVPPASE